MFIMHRVKRYFTEKVYKALSLVSRRRGVTSQKRNVELIVSLTSIAERIDTLHICIESLLRQDLRPDRIILWLSEGRTPDGNKLCLGTLPTSLTSKVKRGLEIRWCSDFGPFRKLYPTLIEYPNAIIVTADDDVIYPHDWLRRLYDSYEKDPTSVHCHIAHRITFTEDGIPQPYSQWEKDVHGHFKPSKVLFPVGAGGVLYAPEHLHQQAINKDEFLCICPRADDIWWKAMSLLSDTAVTKVEGSARKIFAIKIPCTPRLFEENVVRFGNDEQLKQVNEAFGCFNLE